MTPFSFLLVFLLAIFFTSEVWAQSDLKIAVIDIKRVVNTSKYGQEVMEKLQKKYEELQAKIDAKAKELEALREEIEKKSALWTQEVREKKQNEFQRKLREFRVLQEDSQVEMQELEKKLLDPVFKELEGIIKEYVEKEKLDLVLEKNQPGIYYASFKIDISPKIVELFNAYYEKNKGLKDSTPKKDVPGSKKEESKVKSGK